MLFIFFRNSTFRSWNVYDDVVAIDFFFRFWQALKSINIIFKRNTRLHCRRIFVCYFNCYAVVALNYFGSLIQRNSSIIKFCSKFYRVFIFESIHLWNHWIKNQMAMNILTCALNYVVCFMRIISFHSTDSKQKPH